MKASRCTLWFLWGWGGLWISLALCPGLTPALAQEGPILITQRQKIDKFGFTNIQAAAELIYHFQRDENTSTTNNNTTNITENNFKETFSLSADSYIIHPNLVDLTLGGSFGMTQNSITGNTNSSTLGTALSYNATATFLRKEYAPLTLFAQRSTSQVHSQFSGTTLNTSDTFGADLSIRSLTFPTQLHFEHRITTQDDPTDQRTSQTIQDTFTWHTAYQPTDTQTIDMDYTFKSEEQTGSSINTYQSHDVTVQHNLRFGPDNRYNLDSRLNHLIQTGSTQLTRWRLDESLNMSHSDTFRTQARYSYNQEQRPENEQASHRATAGFIHKLYKSLTTHANLGIASTDNGPQGSYFEKHANIQINYRKLVPLGILNIDLSATISQENNNQQSSTVNIFDEPYVYTDPLPITINHRNIVNGSVIVHNAAAITYIEGLDYTLNYLTDFVRLTVPLGSSINNGDTIYVTYTATSDPSNTTTTFGRGISFRYAIDQGLFKGLDLYASFYQSHQNIVSSEPLSFLPEESTDTLYGINYSIWKLNFRAQRNNHDSVTSPYQTTDFSANYQSRLSNRTSMNLRCNYTTTDYFDEDNQIKILLISGSMNQQFSRNLYINFNAAYRNERDNLNGNTQAHEQSIELRWRRRQTDVYLTGRNMITKSNNQNTLSQIIELGIKRTF